MIAFRSTMIILVAHSCQAVKISNDMILHDVSNSGTRQLEWGEVLGSAIKSNFLKMIILMFVAFFFMVCVRLMFFSCQDCEGGGMAPEKVINKISDVKMVVTEDDLVYDEEMQEELQSFGSVPGEHHFLTLPPSSFGQNNSSDSGLEEGSVASGGRKVPNCCSICISGYLPGETVVWSSNANCVHAFHEDCILEWLIKMRKTQCPCCRNDFIDPNHVPVGTDDNVESKTQFSSPTSADIGDAAERENSEQNHNQNQQHTQTPTLRVICMLKAMFRRSVSTREFAHTPLRVSSNSSRSVGESDSALSDSHLQMRSGSSVLPNVSIDDDHPALRREPRLIRSSSAVSRARRALSTTDAELRSNRKQERERRSLTIQFTS